MGNYKDGLWQKVEYAHGQANERSRMKYQPVLPVEVSPPPKPAPLPQVFNLECVYGQHLGVLMHRGTIYCRSCYDSRNPYGKLIDP